MLFNSYIFVFAFLPISFLRDYVYIPLVENRNDKKWHDPQLNRVLANYEKCKEEFEKVERKIYNTTVGGKLELFDRVEYNSLFKG